MSPDATPPTPNPPALTGDQLRIADTVIGALAGDGAHLRPDQLRAVSALVHPRPGARRAGHRLGQVRRVLDGHGHGRAAGRGPTLIVSPLLSLMRDQVAAAGRAGLRAATLNSSNFGDWEVAENDLRSGDLDVLLVSPERLANPGFGRRVLDDLSGHLGLLVIDEAHAISDWGHDFRPDYRRVSDVLRNVESSTPVLATTATAIVRVTADVAGQLGTDTLVLRGPLARKSLHLNVIDGLSPMQRYAWTARGLPALPGSGIVYVLTVADADRLAEAIRSVQGPDYPVAAYTGKFPSTPSVATHSKMPCCATRSGPGGHLGTRHGLRQTRSRLRGARRRTGLAGVVLPAGGPRRPRPRRRRRGAAVVVVRRPDLGVLRHRHHPRPGQDDAASRCP